MILMSITALALLSWPGGYSPDRLQTAEGRYAGVFGPTVGITCRPGRRPPCWIKHQPVAWETRRCRRERHFRTSVRCPSYHRSGVRTYRRCENYPPQPLLYSDSFWIRTMYRHNVTCHSPGVGPEHINVLQASYARSSMGQQKIGTVLRRRKTVPKNTRP